MERNMTFATLTDAFEALPERVRQHSLRVEKYADIIFLELCAAEAYTININARVRLRSENRTLVQTAARYHDLGKVLVPEMYQWNDPDFSQEELALYRRHCMAGDVLVHDTLGDRRRVDPMTTEVIVESILCHHERWDGKGYPRGLSEEHIPIIGRIVEVADELDHRLMNTRTETPVQTALEAMMNQSAARHDPVIMGLLYEAKHKIDKVFALYRGESRAVPQIPRVIKRKQKRPMWLCYRTIVDINTNAVAAVEAEMQFKRGKTVISLAEAEPLLRRSKLLWDAGFGFAVDACDMAKRMAACEVGGAYVLLPTVPGFFKKRGAAAAIAKMMADTDSDPARIAFMLSPEDMKAPTVTITENCQKLCALGCTLVCGGVPLADIHTGTLSELGISTVKLCREDIECMEQHEEKLSIILSMGLRLIGDGVDKHRLKGTLLASEITWAAGTLMGEYISEDELILGELSLAVH